MTRSLNKSKAKIRVLLADDHYIVRAGIRQLLASARDLQIIAEAGDGEEAQALIQKHNPDGAVRGCLFDWQLHPINPKREIGKIYLSVAN